MYDDCGNYSKEIEMQRQHQFHSVLARKYFRFAFLIERKINANKKPDPELVKAYNNYMDIGHQHARTAHLFPECNEFVRVQ